MSARRWIPLTVAALLVAGYGYRAIVGVHTGRLFDRGRAAYRGRSYLVALPLLDQAAVGSNTLRSELLGHLGFEASSEFHCAHPFLHLTSVYWTTESKLFEEPW